MASYAADARVFPAVDDTDLWEALVLSTRARYPNRYSDADISWAFNTACHRLEDYLSYASLQRALWQLLLWELPSGLE